MTSRTAHTTECFIFAGYGQRRPAFVWIFSALHNAGRVASIPLFVIMTNSLTVKEKEHWKDRIAERIDKRINVLCSENPGFMERISQTAHQEALDSLGIAKLQDRLDSIRKQDLMLTVKEEKTHQEMLAKVRGIAVRELRPATCYGSHKEIEDAVSTRQSVHEEELLGKTPLGRDILKLRREKDHLLDTVWLATSPKQIKDLWIKVDEMLGGAQTKLQHEALAIEPLEED